MQKFISVIAFSLALVQAVPIAQQQQPQYLAAKTQDGQAPILEQDAQVNFDGSFRNLYKTGNGIVVEENGVPKNGPEGPITAVQGTSAYTSPEGQVIQLQYIADENGYQAVGDHLPTPPPPHPSIVKALAYLASLPSTQPPPAAAYRKF